VRPTEEQQAAVDLFTAGGNVVVEALAGTGKTAALRFIADTAPNRRGLYAAFNRSIAQEAQHRFQGTGVNARTMHSLAYAEYGVPMRHRLGKQPPLKPTEKAEILGISDKYVLTSADGDGLPGALSRQQLVTCAQHTISAFLRTMDPHVTADDAYLPPALEPKLKPTAAAKLRETIAGFAQTYWRDLQDPSGRLRYVPDAYLKTWALSDPRLPFDYILFDEAQDSDSIISAVLSNQDSQIVAVGDRNQQIYEWRGAHSAMDRFGGDRAVLRRCQPPGTMVTIPVPDPTPGVCGAVPVKFHEVPIEALSAGDKVVSWNQRRGLYKRGNAVTDAGQRHYDGELIQVSVGRRISRYADNHECVVVLGDKLDEGDYVVYLMRRGNQFRIGKCPWRYSNGHGPVRRAVQEGADAVWVLGVYRRPEEVALAEALEQHRFGIPGVMFIGRDKYRMDVDGFWAEVGDNSAAARRCLASHQLLFDMPLWEDLHRKEVHGADLSAPRGARRGGWSSIVVTAAANLRSGMKMLLASSAGESNGSANGYVPWSKWTAIAVNRERYVGPVYSISVADDHTYVADGIVTHNSFRFGPAIADYANMWLEALGAPADMRLVGSDKLATVRRRTPDSGRQPDAVLTRTNAAAIEEIVTAQEHGVDTGIAGEKKSQELRSLAQAALDLKQRGWTSHPELSVFNTWADVRVHAESDDGADVKPLVDLVDRVGADQVVAAIDACVPVEQARTTVSTAHVAKGLEWAQVHIAEDFREPPRKKGVQQPMRAEEARLAYVAATRAKRFLDPRGLEWFPRFLEAGGTVADPSAGYAEMKEAS